MTAESPNLGLGPLSLTRFENATPFGQLKKHEFYWRDRQPWLEERGYMLRPRYRPGWKPYEPRPGESFAFREDSHASLISSIMDAVRISDGSVVIMKKIELAVHPDELEIGQFLCSEQVTSDPRSHCVRILETLKDPNQQDIFIIVMPYLRDFNNPLFGTFGEVGACFKQLIEGLRVMHEHGVAHRDISFQNVMMDATAMFPFLWHPEAPHLRYDYSGSAKHCSRTEKPPQYYYIDFGLSRKYDPKDGQPQELPILGGDKSVPEFQGVGYDEPSDPFRTDIYYLGNLIRTQFLNVYRGFDFMQALVAEMVRADPAERPTIEEVESRFNEIFDRLSLWKLRARLVRKNEWFIERGIYGLVHTIRTAKYLVKRLPPIPIPNT